MSRVKAIEQLYAQKKQTKGALYFDYDKLWAPQILSIFNPSEISQLQNIATSVRYAGNIDKKYKAIDDIMTARGFRKAHSGTNRVVYNFLELPTFVAKVAVDKVGMRDTPAEFKNQELIKPFCCKIFEHDPSGTIGFIERVNPVSSIEEFASLHNDIFNLWITVLAGYLIEDLGCKSYMNFGIRQIVNGVTFGPVVIDFPYIYKADENKLICKNILHTQNGDAICGGEIDYDIGFNKIICPKCGKTYSAIELSKKDEFVDNKLFMFRGEKGDINMNVRMFDDKGREIFNSGHKSDVYVSGNKISSSMPVKPGQKVIKVKTIRIRGEHMQPATKFELSNIARQDIAAISEKYEELNSVNNITAPSYDKVEEVKEIEDKHEDAVIIEASEEIVPEVDTESEIIDYDSTDVTDYDETDNTSDDEDSIIENYDSSDDNEEEEALPEMKEDVPEVIVLDEDRRQIGDTIYTRHIVDMQAYESRQDKYSKNNSKKHNKKQNNKKYNNRYRRNDIDEY